MGVRYRYEFANSSALVADAMMAGTQFLIEGPKRMIWAIMGPVFTMLIGLGGAVLAGLVCRWLEIEAGWWIIAGFTAAGLGFVLHQNLLIKVMAQSVLATAFAQSEQVIEMDDTGVTVMAAGTRWHTPWGAVDAVRTTKQSIVLFIGGMSFSIPKQAVGTQQDVGDLAHDIKAWISHA